MFISYDASGRVIATQQSNTTFSPSSIDGATTIEVSAEQFALASAHCGKDGCFVADGVVQYLPAPSTNYRFDWTTKSWAGDVPAAMRDKVAALYREYGARSTAPITFYGAQFDADSLSRERISGTLARLLRGDGLPVGWMGWRDYDNMMHWSADDAATVQANLAGMARAIENREQALMVMVWQHKAAIQGLTTVEAVLAYDVTAGWPQ